MHYGIFAYSIVGLSQARIWVKSEWTHQILLCNRNKPKKNKTLCMYYGIYGRDCDMASITIHKKFRTDRRTDRRAQGIWMEQMGPFHYIERYRLTSIGIPVIKIRLDYDRIIPIVGILIPLKTLFILKESLEANECTVKQTPGRKLMHSPIFPMEKPGWQILRLG